MAVTNTKGIAAMTHSNRCISLINTGTMKRIAEIDGLTRTVWTLCFHPHDPNLLATGDLGGTVCVFYGTVILCIIFFFLFILTKKILKLLVSDLNIDCGFFDEYLCFVFVTEKNPISNKRQLSDNID